jgi:hypothetical protein
LFNSGFFGNEKLSDDYRLTDEQLFVGTVIFRILNICPTNSHDISEYETPTMEKYPPNATKVDLIFLRNGKIYANTIQDP